MRFFPHVRTVTLRGNLDTRIRKIQELGLAGAILAAAGIRRMGFEEAVSEYLSVETFIPAVGQGVLGIETREDDAFTRDAVADLNDTRARLAVLAERAFLKTLEGGCQVPIAAYARVEGERITLHGMVASLDGKRVIEDSLDGEGAEAESLGTRLAETLLERGAREILKEVYQDGQCGL